MLSVLSNLTLDQPFRFICPGVVWRRAGLAKPFPSLVIMIIFFSYYLSENNVLLVLIYMSLISSKVSLFHVPPCHL